MNVTGSGLCPKTSFGISGVIAQDNTIRISRSQMDIKICITNQNRSRSSKEEEMPKLRMGKSLF
jgi:hypothetical protein